ncbi:MAG TPA: gliding motility lipoprotein GldH [Crocinitomicaceae bacterium]|nr:gliding motility lipoprotein GldH [Crocinitomicaceae bacterium]
MMRLNKVLIIGILFYILSSCGEIPHFEKVYSFKNREWNLDVKPSYKVNIEDVNSEYNFTLSLRVTTDYKYSNIWVFMKTESPDGTTAREPFEIKLTDDKGVWVGNKTGSIVETSLYFKKRKLPLRGEYTFTLEQGITESLVDEVLDLGFKVEKGK